MEYGHKINEKERIKTSDKLYQTAINNFKVMKRNEKRPVIEKNGLHCINSNLIRSKISKSQVWRESSLN